LRETPLVVEGVEEVLAAIHGRWRMGVVTSSRKDHFDLIHARTGLLKYFDFALTADDVDRVKPDPELYRLGVARIGSGADRCVAIEDSERGLTAALEAGVRCIAVPSRLTRGTPFEGAAAVLDSIRGVPAALAALEHHGPLDLRS
jgi:HAD superfamily hydrolase (TIGR01509 family)